MSKKVFPLKIYDKQQQQETYKNEVKDLLNECLKSDLDKILVIGINSKSDLVYVDWSNMPLGERIFYLEHTKNNFFNE